MKYLRWGILFFVLAYLLPIAGRPLLRPDEFRYAEIPREMLETGNFTAPRLLQVRYFEKPVLGYWMIAGSFRIFGETKFALRLPMALATGITALLLALWLRRVTRDREWALWAALFFMSCGLVAVLGTTAVLDALLCLFTTATLLCVHQAVATEKWCFERVVWLVLCGVSAGLGFMTKGLIAWAVPGSAALAWLLWTKRFRVLLWLPWIPLAALAATVAPWALEIHRAEPDFWNYFIVVEHLQRFRAGSEAQHPEPFWFFVPILVGTLFPALLSVFSGAGAGRDFWCKAWHDETWRFAFCGWLLPFCFFSASSGKLATYILPCYPFLAAVLTLPALEALRTKRQPALTIQRIVFDVTGWLALVGGSGSVAFGAALGTLGKLKLLLPGMADGWHFFVLIGAVAAAGGIVMLRRRGEPFRQLAVFFGTLALANATSVVLPVFDSSKFPENAMRSIVATKDFDPATAMTFTYGQLAHVVSWTLKRPDTRLIQSAGELDYGAELARREGRPLLWNGREFNALLRRSDRPDVVFFVAYIDGDDRRIRPFAGHPHRKILRDSIMALVFPPATEVPPEPQIVLPAKHREPPVPPEPQIVLPKRRVKRQAPPAGPQAR